MLEMPNLEVTSEIYAESNYKTAKTPTIEGNIVSEFPFVYPQEPNGVNYDEDGDLIVKRPERGVVQIEHSVRTGLQLVGLQVWRGAFLLGDLALHWGLKGALRDSTVLELGAGTGLTSFVAAIYAKRVVCTDVDLGGILDLIKINSKLNESLVKSTFLISSLDFTKEFTPQMKKELTSVDIIFAADVIYDDTLTEAFVNVLEKLLNSPPRKKIIIALEKRYVFTLADMDSVAPCYETFLMLLDKAKYRNLKYNWHVQQIPIDFPQYFTYDRVKELILWEISSGNV